MPSAFKVGRIVVKCVLVAIPAVAAVLMGSPGIRPSGLTEPREESS